MGTINPNGTWTLKVYDAVSGTTGTLNSWSVNISNLYGTDNYLPKWTDDGLSSTSDVYDNGTNVGIGTINPTDKFQVNDGDLGIVNDNNTAGNLKFYEPSTGGNNYMSFKAQAMAANVTYTLPAADGTSGQLLSTNGSGTLSWATPGSGTAYGVNSTATDPTTLGLCTFAAYSELGEATVTVSSTSTVVVTQASFSGAFSNAANGMAIRVTRSQTAGSGTVGTAVCYGATYKGNTIFSINAGMSETGLTAGTWYYKFWVTPNYSAGSQNYSMIVTPH